MQLILSWYFPTLLKDPLIQHLLYIISLYVGLRSLAVDLFSMTWVTRRISC